MRNMTATNANQARMRQLHTRNTQLLARLRSPCILQWWEWGKIIGAAGLIALTIFLLVDYVPHPAVVAVLLHVATDFTFQSPETALRKGERGRHLLVHALVAGGLPLAVAGLVAGSPVAVVTWTAIGVASHYAVDWTRRFGLRQVALPALLDQICHLLTILILVLLD
jgi:hypothetical protein